MTDIKHPRQPVVLDAAGVPRYKENAIVVFMREAAACGMKFNLNDLAQQMRFGGRGFPPGPVRDPFIGPERLRVPIEPFSMDDYSQFIQLMGYSVSGAGELSSFDPEIDEYGTCEAARLKRKP